MPKLGEIKRGKSSKLIWQACENCGKRRWVRVKQGIAKYRICFECNSLLQALAQPRGEKAHNWKGGRTIDSHGYIWIKLQPEDTFYPMAGKRGYVPEHRLIMAKSLNRCLLTSEVVHHKNHVKTDNSINNLELMPTATHNQVTRLETRIKWLEAENKKLREELKKARLGE